MLKIFETSILEDGTKGLLMDLWNAEYPVSLRYNDLEKFDTYFQKLEKVNHYLLMYRDESVVAWSFTFDRSGERWFGLLVSENFQGQGLGLKMIDHLKNKESILNGWVIDQDGVLKSDGTFYKSPLPFYEKCEFKVLTNIRLETDQISAVKVRWVRGDDHMIHFRKTERRHIDSYSREICRIGDSVWYSTLMEKKD